MKKDFTTAPLAPGLRGAGGGTVEKSFTASHTKIQTRPWIEEQVASHHFIPPLMTVHSANPAARIRMEAAIRTIETHSSKMVLNRP